MYLLYDYGSTGYYRLVEFKNCKSFSRIQTKIHQTTSTENIYKNNISRSKTTVKDIALSNDFNYFVTITIKNDYNRYNIDNCFTFLSKFCKKYKRKYKSFNYIFIAEFHKDGAIHFHGLCDLPQQAIQLDLYNITIKNQKNDKFYHCFSSLIFDDFGRNTFQPIQSKRKIASYILKYITKDCVRTSTHRLYTCSRGLIHGDKTYFDNDELNKIFENRKHFENDYYKIVDFYVDDLSRQEKFDLMYSKEAKPFDNDYEFQIFMNKFKNLLNNT